MIRVLAVVAGLFGAVGLSQFPEYSQQYMQRLSGAVEELDRIVARFDADAESVGLTRSAALVDLASGGRMGEARALSMQRVVERHARLREDLLVLEGTTTVGKLLKYRRFSDDKIAKRALDDFKPAVPVTTEGFGFGAAGFGLGYSLVLCLGFATARLLRRRPSKAQPA
ncbi:DUF2937 family protein [Roseovarius aestuariivivens]|uniref:DUF2937 family protein n=1 Tax=Roseovarius aestuariivivens TaxID=1888910 RepID=UPI001080DF8F|nr:DUF2937 family protein [Roseovarius aestuariivivens]